MIKSCSQNKKNVNNSNSKGICIEYILNGKCNIPNCNFKHDLEYKLSERSLDNISKNNYKSSDICRNFINNQYCNNPKCRRIHIEFVQSCDIDNNSKYSEFLDYNIQDLNLISFQGMIEMSSLNWKKAISEYKINNIDKIEIKLNISQFSIKLSNWASKIIDYFKSFQDIHKLYKYLETTVLSELKDWLNFSQITTTPLSKENFYLIIKWILISKIEAELRFITGINIEKKINNYSHFTNPNYSHMRYLKHQNYRIDFLNYLICCQLNKELSDKIIYFIDNNLYPCFRREISNLSQGRL